MLLRFNKLEKTFLLKGFLIVPGDEDDAAATDKKSSSFS